MERFICSECGAALSIYDIEEGRAKCCRCVRVEPPKPFEPPTPAAMRMLAVRRWARRRRAWLWGAAAYLLLFLFMIVGGDFGMELFLKITFGLLLGLGVMFAREVQTRSEERAEKRRLHKRQWPNG